jgi:hypothetical protein
VECNNSGVQARLFNYPRNKKDCGKGALVIKHVFSFSTDFIQSIFCSD